MIGMTYFNAHCVTLGDYLEVQNRLANLREKFIALARDSGMEEKTLEILLATDNDFCIPPMPRTILTHAPELKPQRARVMQTLPQAPPVTLPTT